MTSSGHRCCHLLLIIGTLFFFLAAAFFNALSSNEIGREWGIYTNSTGDISDIYDTDITPSGWTFTIWGLIYFWQILWIIYALSLTCRRGIDGGYLYYSPPIMPADLFITYMVNMGLNISWTILFDRQEMLAALIIIMLLAVTLWLCLFFSFRAVNREGAKLVHLGFKREPGLVVAFVHNGLAMYATWVNIATLLNLTIVLMYDVGFDAEHAALLITCILMVELLAWFLIENIALDPYTRWTITPYFVVVFALAGVLDNNYVAGETNSIVTLVLMGVAILCLILKLVTSTIRQCRRPLWSENPEKNMGPV